MVAQLEVVGGAVLDRARLDLRLLGPTELSLGGRPVPLRTRKTLALLAYLAAEGGTHRRAELAALLWPESEEHKARTTLRSAVHDLRGALRSGSRADGEYLLVERDVLRLAPAAEADLDLAILRSAYESARRSIGVILPGEQRRDLTSRLRDGAEAYRGDFMAGFFLDDAPDFDYWASLEREAWRARLAAVLDRLSGLLLEGGEVHEAVAVAERWAGHEPAGGAAHERLMRTRYAIGDPAGALRAYEQLRSALGTGSQAAAAAPDMAALAARIRSSGIGSRSGRSPLDRRQPPANPRAGSRTASGVPLVGRAHEFGSLAEELSLAASSGARVAAVVGEAGIGKTRLAEELLLWALAEGSDVLRGDGPGPNRSVPYGSVISAIRYRLERERAPDDLLDDVWLAELARLLPELRERYPDLPPPPPDETTAKSRLFEAVARLFEALARRAPVTVFVDDLHWADAATLDLLRYLAARLATEQSPVLVLVAMRAEDLDGAEQLRGWLLALERAVPVRRLELASLDEHGSRQLLLALTDDGAADVLVPDLDAYSRRLHAETGGHPFFLVETIKAALEHGSPARPDGRAQPGLLPPSVRGLIRERLAGAGLATTDLLSAAAVLCDHIDFELLRRVAGLDEREGLAALDEAVRRRLLREPRRWRGDGLGGYSFVHDTVRVVVYADAGAARRRVFHRRALEALTAHGAPASELARHAVAAGAGEAAVRHSLTAAEEALGVFAVEDARAHLGRARPLLDLASPGGGTSRPDAVGERLRVYAALSRVHELTREWGEAHAAYEVMLTAAREAGDRTAEWTALHRLATLGIRAGVAQTEREGQFHRGAGRPAGVGAGADQDPRYAWSPVAVRARAAEALDLARDLGDEFLVAQTLTALATLEAYAGRWERVLAAGEEGVSLYARLGDRIREGELLNLVAHGLYMTGRAPEAVRRMRDHPSLTGDHRTATVHRADVHGLALALIETGSREEALQVARDGVVAARSTANAPRLAVNLLALGDALRVLSRLDEAEEVYREMGRVLFPPEYRALVHAKLCAVAAQRGRWGEAHAEALLAVGIRDAAPVQITEALHRHVEVAALLRGGDRELAAEQLARFGAAIGENRRLRLAHRRALAVLTRWDGNDAAAVEHLQEASRLAEELGLPGELRPVEAELAELLAGRTRAAVSAAPTTAQR